MSDGDKIHAYYNFWQNNWQIDVIATDIEYRSFRCGEAFVNADGSKTFFSEQTEYLTNPNDRANQTSSQISTSDLDGNGLDDIIHSDGHKVLTYYNLGQDNWQMDVIATHIKGFPI